jgi:hypothetical protein
VLLKTTAGAAVVAKLQAGGAKADVFFPTIDVLGKSDSLQRICRLSQFARATALMSGSN